MPDAARAAWGCQIAIHSFPGGPMLPPSRRLALFALVLAAACADNPATGPRAELSTDPDHGDGPRLAVMTLNLYVGADVDAVIGALASSNPSDDLPALESA